MSNAKTKTTRHTKAKKPKPKKQIHADVGALAKLKRVLINISFAQKYAIFATLVLLLTTAVWALLGAKLHESNADQLANSFLFESWDTFNNAALPAAHSFLIKWPLFLIIQLLGSSSLTFAAATVALCLVTVGALAYILYRIESRPYVYGGLVLALASVLMFVPAQPYAGGLLPVNMAMIATRNLEYVLYIASLIILIKSPKFNTRGFWLGVLCLGLLVASDKLFLSLGVGGATLALAAYSLQGRWRLARLMAKWLAISLLSFLLASLIIWFLNTSGLINIPKQLNNSPYPFTSSLSQLALGMIYAVLGVLTNFGANPAFDSSLLKNVPSVSASRLFNGTGLAFATNLLIAAGSLIIAAKIFINSLIRPAKLKLDVPNKLAVLLIWSSLAALAAFVFTKHYYFADARYLSLFLFAGFISLAAYLRTIKFKSDSVLIVFGIIMVCSTIIGLFSMLSTHQSSQLALTNINKRNVKVVNAVNSRRSDVLVGDYWRVLPMKLASSEDLRVMPLDNCTQPRQGLSSKNWQPDLSHTSFAYLLALDKSLTDYPNCSLEQVVKTYGSPDQSVLIDGTPEKPVELVLFYDKGTTELPKGVVDDQAVNIILPVRLSSIPDTDCPSSSTIMNIVAHQDDDLLFMNPDLAAQMRAGHCIRTIYITAGDAGAGEHYWQAREKGSQAAYSTILGVRDVWTRRSVKLDGGQYITVATLTDNPHISVVYMRLPDGNVAGQGFRDYSGQSLVSLESGRIETMSAVDGQAQYNSSQLINGLVELMRVYKPERLNAMATYDVGTLYPDHSDHKASARFAQKAYEQYAKEQNNQSTGKITHFIGYGIHERPINLSAEEQADKLAAFLAYAKFDPGVCQSLEECQFQTVYGYYLTRRYTTAD